MKNRYLASLALLAVLASSTVGCVTGSATRVSSAPAKHGQTTHAVAKVSAPPSPATGVLTEAEAPRIASATKFADAPSAADSPQTRSMREQFARKYGCCGR